MKKSTRIVVLAAMVLALGAGSALYFTSNDYCYWSEREYDVLNQELSHRELSGAEFWYTYEYQYIGE